MRRCGRDLETSQEGGTAKGVTALNGTNDCRLAAKTTSCPGEMELMGNHTHHTSRPNRTRQGDMAGTAQPIGYFHSSLTCSSRTLSSIWCPEHVYPVAGMRAVPALGFFSGGCCVRCSAIRGVRVHSISREGPRDAVGSFAQCEHSSSEQVWCSVPNSVPASRHAELRNP